jgi:hypothetical protein
VPELAGAASEGRSDCDARPAIPNVDVRFFRVPRRALRLRPRSEIVPDGRQLADIGEQLIDARIRLGARLHERKVRTRPPRLGGLPGRPCFGLGLGRWRRVLGLALQPELHVVPRLAGTQSRISAVARRPFLRGTAWRSPRERSGGARHVALRPAHQPPDWQPATRIRRSPASSAKPLRLPRPLAPAERGRSRTPLQGKQHRGLAAPFRPFSGHLRARRVTLARCAPGVAIAPCLTGNYVRSTILRRDRGTLKKKPRPEPGRSRCMDPRKKRGRAQKGPPSGRTIGRLSASHWLHDLATTLFGGPAINLIRESAYLGSPLCSLRGPMPGPLISAARASFHRTANRPGCLGRMGRAGKVARGFVHIARDPSGNSGP